jgi:hypothetical protein
MRLNLDLPYAREYTIVKSARVPILNLYFSLAQVTATPPKCFGGVDISGIHTGVLLRKRD